MLLSAVPNWFYAIVIALAIVFIAYSEWNSRK